MKHIIPLLCLCISNWCFAQHSQTNKCALKKANHSWSWEYKKTRNLDLQLELVVDKIVANANYYDRHPPIENLDDRSMFGTLPCSKSCAISVGVIYGKNKGILLDIHKYPELEEILEALNSETISQIDFNEHRNSIYQAAVKQQPGIVLYTQDKELIKLLRRKIREIERREKRPSNDKTVP